MFVVLGRCLATAADTEEALKRYDSLRRKPSQRIAATARRLGLLTMSPRMEVPRNALLQLGGLLMR